MSTETTEPNIPNDDDAESYESNYSAEEIISGDCDECDSEANRNDWKKKFTGRTALPIQMSRAKFFDLSARYYEYVIGLSDDIFEYYFHISKRNCITVIEQIIGSEKYKQLDSAVQVHIFYNFLIAYHYFSTGNYRFSYEPEHQNEFALTQLNRSIPLARSIIIDVAWYITFYVNNAAIKYPQDKIEQFQMQEEFMDKFHFERIVGVLDCVQVSIFTLPRMRSNMLINTKKYESLNVEVVCDANLIFQSVRIFNGAIHDAFTFGRSAIRKNFLKKLTLEKSTPNDIRYLLADNAYSMERFLLTPFTEVQTDAEANFNRLHAKVFDSTVKRAIELVRSQFRCLLKHRPIQFHFKSADMIIRSCFTLYNILMKMKAIDMDMVVYEVDDMDEVAEKYKYIPKPCPHGLKYRKDLAERLTKAQGNAFIFSNS